MDLHKLPLNLQTESQTASPRGKSLWFLACLCLFGLSPTSLAAKKKITLAWENMPKSFDSRYATDANSQYLEDLLHCSLISFGPDGSTTPELATSWKWLGNTELELDISKEFKFSDGTPVTAQDIVATYSQFTTGKLPKPSARALAFKNIKTIKVVPKENKIRIALNNPDSAFITNLVVGIFPSKSDFTKVLDRKSKIIGCGPFALRKSSINYIHLSRNNYYPLTKSTSKDIEQIFIKIVKDETTRFAKLRKGELDLVQNEISLDRAAKIASAFPDLKVQKTPALSTTYLGFNFQDSALKNKNVRQAISHAINKSQIVEYVYQGFAKVATGMLPSQNPFSALHEEAYPFSKERAKQLLDEAGFKPKANGIRLELSYKTSQNATRVMIAKAIASQLKDIGIDVNVQSMEWGRFQADISAGNFQLWGLSWVGFKDPDILRYAFATESFPPNGGNRGKFSNLDLDKVLSAAIKETDIEERKKLYLKAQNIIKEEVPYVFLWHPENFAVMRKRVANFKVYADGRYSSLEKVQIQ